jgi:hypothetical protein
LNNDKKVEFNSLNDFFTFRWTIIH